MGMVSSRLGRGVANSRGDPLNFLRPGFWKQPWLLGDHFTAADAYLFTITAWAACVGVDLSAFPALLVFQKTVAQRSAVQKAMLEEG